MPVVSIIMPVFNGEKFISKAIHSILMQDYDNFELICIDDGSTDKTKEIILSFNDNRINYIYQQHSGKPSIARNKGIKSSRGDYIAFIDHDDIFLYNSLSERIKFFDDNPGINFVYSDCEIINEKGEVISKSVISYSNKKACSGKCFKELFGGIFIPTQGVMLKKDILDKVGLFNENLLCAEDYNLWLRIAYYYPLGYIDRILAQWRNHDTSLTKKSYATDKGFFECLNDIVNLFPDCVKIVGEEHLKKRMSLCAYEAVCHNVLHEDLDSYRKLFQQGFKYNYFNLRYILRYIVLLLRIPRNR